MLLLFFYSNAEVRANFSNNLQEYTLAQCFMVRACGLRVFLFPLKNVRSKLIMCAKKYVDRIHRGYITANESRIISLRKT